MSYKLVELYVGIIKIPEVFFKKVFLKISQEHTSTRVSVSIKLQASGLQLYLKKRFRRRFFSVNFAKFLRTTVFYRAPPVVSLITKSLRTQTCKYNKYASVQMPRVNRRWNLVFNTWRPEMVRHILKSFKVF